MNDKEKNFVSAVIYVHNASERIGAFLETVLDVLETHFEHSEIICINDHSTDDSRDILKKAASQAKSASITLVDMSFFHGLEVSMNAGLDLTIGDFVLEFDNTFLDFRKDDILDVYRKSLEGFDVVSAVPYRRERLSSRCFYRVFNRFSNNQFDLKTETFRILSRRVINRISSMNKTIPYRKVIYAYSGLRRTSYRYFPLSDKLPPEDAEDKHYRLELAVDALILFTKVGYRLSMAMTLAMMLMAVFMFVYSLTTYLTANPIAGWTTTILFLSFSFFGLFGILTIVIKYLQILIGLVFKRQYYSFEGIEKLSK